jgi:hypothetical protein
MTDVEQTVYAYAMKHKTISTARIAAGTGLDVSEVQAVLSKVGTPKEILLSNGWSDDVLTPRRVETLETAINLTAGDRNKSYGPPYNNLSDCALLWDAYLAIRGGKPVDAEAVAWMNVLQKIARSCQPGYHPDNYTDAAAYSAIAGECREIEEANNERHND